MHTHKRLISTILALAVFVSIHAGIPVQAAAADGELNKNTWDTALADAPAWQSKWDVGGDWGIIIFTQNGISVAGTYDNQLGRQGRIEGSVSGNNLTGYWVQSDYKSGGAFEASLTPDGMSINIRWNNDESALPPMPVQTPSAPQSTPPPAAQHSPPQPGAHRITMVLGDAYMYADGVKKEIDPGRGTTAVTINDRTMIPIRAVAEEIGGTVDWEEASQTVVINTSTKEIRMTIGSKTLSVNGQIVQMDTAPLIRNERTLVPVRFAAEQMGCAVDWDGSARMVIISYIIPASGGGDGVIDKGSGGGAAAGGGVDGIVVDIPATGGLNVTPIKGLTISADAGAMGGRTALIVKELSPTDAEAQIAVDLLVESASSPLKIYKIDAGLKPGETLPGMMQISIDLSELGLTQGQKNLLSVSHIDDDGNVEAYPFEVSGNTLSYSTDKNPISVLGLGLALTAVWSGYQILNKALTVKDIVVSGYDALKYGDYIALGAAAGSWFVPITIQNLGRVAVGKNREFSISIGSVPLLRDFPGGPKFAWKVSDSHTDKYIEQLSILSRRYSDIKFNRTDPMRPGSGLIGIDKALMNDYEYQNALYNLTSGAWCCENLMTPAEVAIYKLAQELMEFALAERGEARASFASGKGIKAGGLPDVVLATKAVEIASGIGYDSQNKTSVQSSWVGKSFIWTSRAFPTDDSKAAGKFLSDILYLASGNRELTLGLNGFEAAAAGPNTVKITYPQPSNGVIKGYSSDLKAVKVNGLTKGGSAAEEEIFLRFDPRVPNPSITLKNIDLTKGWTASFAEVYGYDEKTLASPWAISTLSTGEVPEKCTCDEIANSINPFAFCPVHGFLDVNKLHDAET